MDSRTNSFSRMAYVRDNNIRLTLSDMFSNGWKIFKEHAMMMILYFIVFACISFVGGMLANIFQGNAVVYMSCRVVLNLVNIPLTFGFLAVAHYAVNNREYSFANFFDGFRFFGKVFFINLVTSLLQLVLAAPALVVFIYVGFGGDFSLFTNPQQFAEHAQDMDLNRVLLASLLMFVLLLPAIYMQLCFQFSPLLYVFSDFTLGESLKSSFQVVNRNIGAFFGYIAAVIGLVFLSMFTCFIGLIVLIPLLFCIQAWAYNFLFQPETDHERDITDHIVQV